VPQAPAAAPATSGADAGAALRVCLFALGGALFAVEVRHAREVVVLDHVTRVPLAPAAFRGVTNLRGYILPVLDAGPPLGLPARAVGRGSRVLVLAGEAGQVGIAIDAARGLETADRLLPLGEAARRQYGEIAQGLWDRGDRLVTLLDVPRLLAALGAERGEGRG